jgi:predicted nucleic acid-binding protein
VRYLVDTNILLRFAITTASQSDIVRTAVEQLEDDDHELFVTIQNLSEFWNVATRSQTNNGFGLIPEQANIYLTLLEKSFPLITESIDSYHHWRKLIIDYNVSGVKVHDARLVAVMLAHGVERILTFNDQDFQRYEPAGIQPIHPQTILPAE